MVGLFGNRADAQTVAKFTRQSDVIYGRKYGVALTMEVFTPATRNGFGAVWVVSSSGISSREQTPYKTPLNDASRHFWSVALASLPSSTEAHRSLMCRI